MSTDTSGKFDRVRKPAPTRHRAREGKEALFSTAPTAPAPGVALLVCGRCDVETSITLGSLRRAVSLPFVINPLARTLWMRCPACAQRSWLSARMGPAARSFLSR